MLSGVSYWRGHHIPPLVLGTLGGILVAGGLLVPTYLGPLYRAWMRFALVLSKITTPIITALLYFGLFTPVGFIRRLIGRNSLVRSPGASFWITREPGAGRRSDLGRQF